MDEEPELPQLSAGPSTESFPPRKRARLSSPIISSDAIFSSDDDPSAENYVENRQKQMYRGPWYSQQPASDLGSSAPASQHIAKGTKRKFERQYDSGVWLGSDSSDADSAINYLDSTQRHSGATRPNRLGFIGQSSMPRTAEQEAEKIIADCIEQGTETINLSLLGLERLSNETIRPLATFTSVPRIPLGVEGIYTRLVPALKVNFSLNELTNLPKELFELESLIALTLRNNKLRKIPPAIGKLRNLTELNLSQNHLHYLPYEILDLFTEDSHLLDLRLHPNPFYAPRPRCTAELAGLEGERSEEMVDVRKRRGGMCVISPDHRRRSWHPQWILAYECRSETRFFNSFGTLVKGPLWPHEESVNSFSVSTRAELHTMPSNCISRVDSIELTSSPSMGAIHTSAAPSLLESALQACSRHSQLNHLHEYLPKEHPEHIPKLLSMASNLKESGGRQCTICQRNFIIPRTEWIEWWEIERDVKPKSRAIPRSQTENERDKIERFIPLIRRGCSWLCVPEDASDVEKVAKQLDRESDIKSS